MALSLKERKNELRKELTALRGSITEADRAQYEASMLARLLSLASYRYAETVLLYFPIKCEPNILMGVFDAAVSSGKRVAFPLCDRNDLTLTYRFVSSLKELDNGAYGIKEPPESAPVYIPSKTKNDVMLVPGIGYDRHGFRLGYGKGYYDRYLCDFGGTAIGVTFDRLFLKELPRGKFDRAVNLILTERGAFSAV